MTVNKTLFSHVRFFPVLRVKRIIMQKLPHVILTEIERAFDYETVGNPFSLT